MDIPGIDDHEHLHHHDDMADEIHRAIAEKRQPLCVHCHQPLQVAQRVEEQIVWYWNAESKTYEKMRVLLDVLDHPYCTACNTEDEHLAEHSWFKL